MSVIDPRPMKANSTDPFSILDDLSLHYVIDQLSVKDMLQCSAVNTNWRARVQYYTTPSQFIRRFPDASPGWALRRHPVHDIWMEFLRTGYRSSAMRRGESTWVLRYTDVDQYSVSGNHMVWINLRGECLYWQQLTGSGVNGRNVGPIRVLELSRLRDSEAVTVVQGASLVCNPDGLVYMMILVRRKEDDISPPLLAKDYYWHIVFSLPEWKVKWSLDSTTPAIDGCMVKIAVGKSCIYSLHKIFNSSDNSDIYSLIRAVNIDTGATMFTTHVEGSPSMKIFSDRFNIIRSLARDYIVWSCDTLRGKEHGIGFIVVDGDTGSIINQWTYITTSEHRGLDYIRAVSDPDGFLISYESSENDLGNSNVWHHTSFQLSENLIQRAAVKVIVNSRRKSVFHPSLPHGIRIGLPGFPNGNCIHMITIARRDSCQHSHSKTPVESTYYVESETEINGAAGIPVPWDDPTIWHWYSRPLVLDENRFGVEAIAPTRQMCFTKNVFIFDFAAPW